MSRVFCGATAPVSMFTRAADRAPYAITRRQSGY
jgi:hypothetical protein